MSILDRIAKNRAERATLSTRITELDAELAGPEGLVRKAFDEGIAGADIARATGLTAPRVFQIRRGDRGKPKKA